MSTSMRVSPGLRASLIVLLVGVAGTSAVAAQPRDGYVGPETPYEPQPAGPKHGRDGGGWSSEWRWCAGEGEQCSVRGWGVVRYGTRGRYVYREVRNASVYCDNTMFGDPAPGRGKRCEVRLFDDRGWGGGWQGDDGWQGGGWQGDRGWQRCAREYETCRIGRRGAIVRFGIDGRYYEREVRGRSVFCGTRNFGDPAPGRRKVCEVRLDDGRGWQGGGWQGGGGWAGGGPGGRWMDCAQEGGYCPFRGRRSVWYGAEDGRHVVRVFRDGVPCTNEAFGGDPAPRQHKRCAIEGY